MRIYSKDLFETLQLESEKQVDQYYFKFPKKSSYGSRGQICLVIDPKLVFPKNYLFDQIGSYGSCGLNVAQLSHTSTQAFIWGFVVTIFFKFCSMVQHKKYKKITKCQFGPDCDLELYKFLSQNLHLGFFFKFCIMIGHSKFIKGNLVKFPKKSYFGWNLQFSPDFGLKLWKLISQDFLL